MILGPAKFNQDGTARSDTEIHDKAKTVQGQIRGFLQSLDVQTGQPVGEADQAIYSFFNVGGWKGRQFMGFIKLVPEKGQWPAQNRLQGYRNLSDEKQGIDAWRAKASNGAASDKAQSI